MNRAIEKELSTYFEIMLNQRASRVKVASTIEAKENENIDTLWREHEHIQNEFKNIFNTVSFNSLEKPDFSYLDLKIKIGEKIFESCYFCEMKCHINRNIEKGFCNVKNPKIASEFMHMGEETPLIPSHTIFFTGCNFECIYCQNFDISQFPEAGIKISEMHLAKIIDKRRKEGSRNVNFVGGDPTPNLYYILKTMKQCNENIPVIWNSNFYMSEDAMKLLDGFVDLFLSDFKYGPEECAEKLSKISNYWNTITRNHKMAKKSGDMIIRHLVLPGHVECCSKPILKWISENLGKETVINIMGQYHPVYRACESEKITRYPSRRELEEVVNYAKNLGFINLI
ncbi:MULTISPECIES: radical SAM protein [Methanobacterium]|nr:MULTISPECIES: radical SAM protein [Methanobacterium]OEC85648.1 radical SAM protein [Methanobacterium sp. A39]